MLHPIAHAASTPNRPAVIDGSTGRTLTYAELADRSAQVAHAIRNEGLGVAGHVALLLGNCVEYLEVLWGALRAGVYVTPVNWHLQPAEVRYIVDDCGASVLFASEPLLHALRGQMPSSPSTIVAVGDRSAGARNYEALLEAQPVTPVADECEGMFMFYSSGTTGRPKGIKSPNIGGPIGEPNAITMLLNGLFGIDGEAVYLSPAPMYHAAPAGWSTGVHRLGGTTVLMDRFDPIEMLELIERYKVTHVQLVPTHMVRLLKLTDAERSRYDLSSLTTVIHAAAPCPVEVKQACMDWFGPIIHEYYSGSEGVGFCAIGPDEWLAHPGSVGRSMMGPVHITDEFGSELTVGEVGQVWFEPFSRFEYHGDPEKTSAAFDDRGWGTLGDMGYVDAEGYLYLTDRVSNMVISGGVNIYPREIEDVLVMHPDVGDVAVIGIPDPEMGESVRAVIQPASSVELPDAFAVAVVEFCRERLSHFKCPTTVALVESVPRLPTGKLAKRLLPAWVREPYPDGRVVGPGT